MCKIFLTYVFLNSVCALENNNTQLYQTTIKIRARK